MTPPSPEDQDRLDMARLREGHDAALSALMDRYGEPLFHYLIRCVHDEGDAEDLAQETFVRIYQHRDRFDSRWKFSTWMFSIATNLARDRRRWENRHPTVTMEDLGDHADEDDAHPLSEAGPSPADAVADAERAEQVRDAVAQLPEDLRVPLLLSEYQGQSHAEIAQILKCSSKSVETRLARARQQLKKNLYGLLLVL